MGRKRANGKKSKKMGRNGLKRREEARRGKGKRKMDENCIIMWRMTGMAEKESEWGFVKGKIRE
jgi:hypothetical protein